MIRILKKKNILFIIRVLSLKSSIKWLGLVFIFLLEHMCRPLERQRRSLKYSGTNMFQRVIKARILYFENIVVFVDKRTTSKTKNVIVY